MLQRGLEECGLVGRRQHVVVAERRFPYPGARLGVEPLDVDVVGLAGVENIIRQHLVLACAQPRVAEHARAQRVEATEIFFVKRLRGLLKDPEFKLGGELRHEAGVARSLDHLLEEVARACRVGLAVLGVEVDEKVRRVRSVRENAKGRRVDSSQGVRIARFPSGDRCVVVELVAHVPSEDDVAETEALLQRGPEFFEADVLASQHSVDVETSDLDLLDALFTEVATQLFAHRSSSGAGSIPLFLVLWAAFLGGLLECALDPI